MNIPVFVRVAPLALGNSKIGTEPKQTWLTDTNENKMYFVDI